jgi:hypothetical protein
MNPFKVICGDFFFKKNCMFQSLLSRWRWNGMGKKLHLKKLGYYDGKQSNEQGTSSIYKYMIFFTFFSLNYDRSPYLKKEFY